MSDDLGDIQLAFLAEGLEDYVGLRQWVKRVRRQSPELEPASFRSEVVRLRRRALGT